MADIENNNDDAKNSTTNKPFIKINRKKFIYFVLILFVICLISGIIVAIVLEKADPREKYPNGRPVFPGKEDAMVQIHPLGGKIKIFKSDDKNKNNRAIILMPGGGYGNISGNWEGIDWVPLLKSLGYTAAVLHYTVPPKTPDDPLNEVIGAMRYLRNTTNGWNVESGLIGVMGFSAGGHLASTAATHIKDDERPAFQILYYPVITMDKSITHKETREHLIGLNPSQELIDLYSNEKQVTAETPPAYVCWPDDDRIVSPTNSVIYVEALKSKGVPVHVKNLKSGGHAFGFNVDYKYHNEVVKDITEWLQDMDKVLTEKTS